MMRLLGWIVVLGIGWSAYWGIAAAGLRTGLSGWFATQETRGWQAEFAGIGTSGYPFRHRTRIDGPALADPATGAAWRADWLEFDNPAIWPGRQTLRFAPGPQRLSYFDRTVALTARDMVAELDLEPGLALELRQLSLRSGPWVLRRDGNAIAGAQDLTVAMTQTDRPDTYRFDIAARDLAPGARLRNLLPASAPLPERFDTLALDLTARFDRPWDRTALEQSRPQPVALDLRRAEMRWGTLGFFAAGSLTVDAAGIPTGEVALRVENWRDILALAEASGAVAPEIVAATGRALDMLSGLSGNPDRLDLTLGLRNGNVMLGPIPLGPAPRLILR